MEKSPKNTEELRLIIGGLSIFLTGAVLFALAGMSSACGPLVNDWTDHNNAPAAAYQTTQAVGRSAQDLLSNTNFKRLNVEIQSVRGFAPTSQALTHLQRFLGAQLSKPNGITVAVSGDFGGSTSAAASRSASPVPATTYTVSDIRSFELRNRHQYPRKDGQSIYILFLDGAAADDSGDTKTLGQAYGNTSIVIYENTLRTEAAKISGLQPWVAEATVMEHEFGHLLGLVNNPTTSKVAHEDSTHPGHCKESTCLMYYTADTTAILPSLAASGQPPELDENCKQDLKAAGGQ